MAEIAPSPIPQPVRTNGFAIASLVLGILGGVVLSVIFAIVALRQIPRRGQVGKGLAVAGLVLSGIWTLLIGVVIAVALATDAERDASGAISEGGDLSFSQVRPGDCLTDLKENELDLLLSAVPCSEPHDGEVYAVVEIALPGDPSSEDIETASLERCLDEADRTPSAASATDVFAYHPTEASWGEGDRDVVCVALVAR